jgi:hypothetical protein
MRCGELKKTIRVSMYISKLQNQKQSISANTLYHHQTFSSQADETIRKWKSVYQFEPLYAMLSRHERRPRRVNNGGALRLGLVLSILAFNCSDALGFETNHPRLCYKINRRLTGTVSTATISPGFLNQSKIRRNCDKPSTRNGLIFSHPLSVNSLMSLSPPSASSNYASLEASTPWGDVLSPQPSSPFTSQATHQSSRHDTVTTYDKAVLTSFTGLAAVAVGVLLMHSAPGAWRYFLAGGICAATSHAIPTPVDVVKVGEGVSMRPCWSLQVWPAFLHTEIYISHAMTELTLSFRHDRLENRSMLVWLTNHSC